MLLFNMHNLLFNLSVSASFGFWIYGSLPSQVCQLRSLDCIFFISFPEDSSLPLSLNHKLRFKHFSCSCISIFMSYFRAALLRYCRSALQNQADGNNIRSLEFHIRFKHTTDNPLVLSHLRSLSRHKKCILMPKDLFRWKKT